MRLFLALLFATLFVVATPAKAADDDVIVYTVRSGDTLITLGEKYFAKSGDYAFVQTANGIRNPRAIPIGTKLRIQRKYLKYRSSTARFASVRGNVSLLSGGRSSKAVAGTVIGEGSTVKTAASSFATLSLENGSRVSLPSNSDLKIVRLRQYVIDSSLDYDFSVARGGAKSTVTPAKNANDRYIMRTPKATSAVRGTDFQSRYDEASGSDFSEVTEGALAVAVSGAGAIDMPAGDGLAVNATGGVVREKLLEPIVLEGAGRLQKGKLVSFDLPKGAFSGLRISLAADAGFVDQIADGKFAGDKAEFAGIDDGNYFVRIRAISANGIEGIPSTYAFKRRLNSILASGGRTDTGFAFKWLGEGRGKLLYHFQLFKDRQDGTAMVDEAGLTQQQISLSDLPAGDYYWRVASVQYLDGEVSTSWTPFEKLTVSAQ
jgi:hypothetical protein